MTLPEHDSYDVIIVGGRCAGASTALLLARQGLRVLVVDRERHGSDTLSTHALMRSGVLQLSRWGLLEDVAAADTPAIRKTSFYYGDDGVHLDIRPRNGVDALYSPRRTVLDKLLIDHAREAGAEICHQARMIGLLRRPTGRVEGIELQDHTMTTIEVRASLVIGADGVRSTVAQEVGAEPQRVGKHQSATIYSHFTGLGQDRNRWYYRPGLSAGMVPTNVGATCVFVVLPPARFRASAVGDLASEFSRALEELSGDLAGEIANARRVDRLRGFAGIRGFVRPCAGPGWALVGDAAYFKDPATAHGISDALRDAELLARAVLAGGARAMQDYQATRDELSLDFFETTDRIASFRWDLPELQALHRRMSQEQLREELALCQLDAPVRAAC